MAECKTCGGIEHEFNVVTHGIFWGSLQDFCDKNPHLIELKWEAFKVKAEIGFWLLVEAAPKPPDNEPALSPIYWLIMHINDKIMTIYYDASDNHIVIAK